MNARASLLRDLTASVFTLSLSLSALAQPGSSIRVLGTIDQRAEIAATGTKVTLPAAMHALISDGSGGLYAGGENDGLVVRLDAAGTPQSSRAMGPSGASVVALAWLRDGSLITAGPNFVTRSKADLTVEDRIEPPFAIRTIAAADDGGVYVAGGRFLAKLNERLAVVWQADLGDAAKTDKNLVAIAVDSHRTVRAVGAGALYSVSASGQILSRVALSTCAPLAMALGGDDSLLVAGSTQAIGSKSRLGQACVQKLTPQGVPLWQTTIKGGGFGTLRTIALSSAGDILVGGSTNAKDLPLSTGTVPSGTAGFSAQLEASGKLLSTRYSTPARYSQLDAVTVTNDGHLWAAGWSDSGMRRAVITRVDTSVTPDGAASKPKAASSQSIPALQACTMTYTVSSTDDSGFGTLRDAAANTCQGGTIAFSLLNPSTITLTTGSIAITNPVAILGPGSSALTINGNGQSRIFYVSTTGDEVTAIDGLTLANGLAQGGSGAGGGGGALGAGGAIFLDSGYLSVTNTVFQNNAAFGGAGSITDTSNAGGGGGGMGGNGTPGQSDIVGQGNGGGGAGGSGGDLGGTGGAGGTSVNGTATAGGSGGPGAGGGGGESALGLYTAGGAGGYGGGGGASGTGGNTNTVDGGAGGFGAGGGAGLNSIGGQFGGNGFGSSPNYGGEAGGGGGAGLGGAIFSTSPQQSTAFLGNDSFTGNSAQEGAGVSNQYGTATAGLGKGGGLFGRYFSFGGVTFSGNTAPDVGTPSLCSSNPAAVDTGDICGALLTNGQLTAVAGNQQSAPVNSAFGTSLSVQLSVGDGETYAGFPVVFSAPVAASGQPGGTFANGSSTYVALTDGTGTATAQIFTANGNPGSYTVLASIAGLSVPFTLINSAVAPAFLQPVGSTSLSYAMGQVGPAFQVMAQDANHNPIAGAQIVFQATSGAATGTFTSTTSNYATAVTGANGIAVSSTFTANLTYGSYTVVASVGSLRVPFTINNVVPSGATLVSQSIVPNTPNAGPTKVGYALNALVSTATGQPLNNVPITFVAPATAATGSFVQANGSLVTTDTEPTNAAGLVTENFDANSTPGTIAVMASTGSLTTTFQITNPAIFTLLSATAQGGNTTALSLHAAGASNQSVVGATINVAVPTSGASGTAQCTVIDANGNAQCLFYGNNVAGVYNITLSTPGIPASVVQTITNYSYSFTTDATNLSVLLGQFFPTFHVTVSGGPVSQLTFSTPQTSTGATATINGSYSASTQVAQSEFSSPPLLAGLTPGPYMLQVAVNPNIVDQIQLVNVKGYNNSVTEINSFIGPSQGSYPLNPGPGVEIPTSRYYVVLVQPRTATGKVTINLGGLPVASCELPPTTDPSDKVNGCLGTIDTSLVGELSASYAGDKNTYPSHSADFLITPADGSTTTFQPIVVQSPQPVNTGSGGAFEGGGCTWYSGGINLAWTTACAFESNAIRADSGPRPRADLTLKAATSGAGIQGSLPLGQGPHSIAEADFNGDGVGDLAVTNGGDKTVSIFPANADGSLKAGATYAVGGSPTAIVTGDFNHDGLADWAVATDAGSIYVALGLGDGTFTLPMPYQASGTTSVMRAADFNGDGVSDLVTVDSSTGIVHVYLNDGTGRLTLVPSAQQPGSQPKAIVAGDFNNDGKVDLAIAYYAQNASDSTNQGAVAVLLGKGDGTFNSPSYVSGGRPLSVMTGMYSGKGFLDLIVGYAQANLEIYAGKGDGSFTPLESEPVINASTILTGNFSGTGRSDIIAMNGTTSVFQFRNLAAAGPDLTIAKSHSGSLYAGQKGATYTITVTNVGQASSSGLVKVSEVPDSNLTITAMGGTGWTCATPLTCTRNDALAAGESYPPLTAIANVSSAAANFVTNSVQVSGGGDTIATDNTSTDGAILVLPQHINFPAIAEQVVGSQVSLNATSSSGLPVSYSSLTPSVCTVTGSVVSLVSAGTCTIEASQSGNAEYAPAPLVSQSFSAVVPFSITPLPGSETVSRGRLAAFLLELQSDAGFKGVVTLSCTVPVANAVCADLPARVNLQGGKAAAVSGVLFPQNTPLGTYTVTFTGVSGSYTAHATAAFTVK